MADNDVNEFRLDLDLPTDNAFNPDNELSEDITMPGALPLDMDAPTLSTTEELQASLYDTVNNMSSRAEDPFQRGKLRKFDASLKGTQFERYYHHPRFKSLGFTPFRDNEVLYNENSNFFDEMGRATVQAGNLAGLGFMDSMTFGSLTDTENARKFEKAMEIGSTSKGGFGGFMTNLYLNSGYTVGILAEAALEELALGLITGASLATTSELTIPMMIEKGIRTGRKLREGYLAGKNIIRALDALKDINKARAYFKQAAANTGRFLNPVQEGTDFLMGMSKLDGLDNVAKTSLGMASFYRDVRNLRLAWSEAGLEGGMVRNRVEEELLQEHLATHNNRPPTEEEAKAIRETALRAGMTTGWQNVGVIAMSNKVVFDNLFSGFKALSRVTDDVVDVAGHKILKTTGDAPWEFIEKNLKGLGKLIRHPGVYAKTGLGYFKANVAEGFQETAQEVIGGAASDEAKAEWRGDPLRGGYYTALVDNLQKQASPEGFEIFMSGFLMGGLVQPVVKAPSYINQTYKRFFKKDAYAAEKKRREDFVENATKMLNDLWRNNRDALAPELKSLENQAEYQKALKKAQENNDPKTFYDLKDMSYADNIITALQLGRFDSFIERLADQKNLSKEEVEELGLNLTQEAYFDIIDKSIDRAEKIKARYEHSEKKLKNPFNPKQFKNPATKIIEQSNYDAWEDARKDFLFAQHSFDRTLERMTSIMGEAQKDTALTGVAMHEFGVLYNRQNIVAEQETLKTEIASLENATTTDQKKLLREKKDKLRRLDKFYDSYKALETAPKISDKSNKINYNDPMTKKIVKEARRRYHSYMRGLANKTSDYVFDEALDTAFDKLIDYYELSVDADDLSNAVNMMVDPGVFTRKVARTSEVKQKTNAIQQQQFKADLDAFIDKAKAPNDLAQLLLSVGVFLDPKEFTALVKEKKIPEQFTLYNVTDSDSAPITPVSPLDPKYDKAIDILLKYIPDVLNIPITKVEADRLKNKYDYESRAKFTEDVRTFADLKSQYFKEDSTMPLKTVLEKIMQSEYATIEEQALAEKLLEFASDGETITFVTDSTTPVQYGTTRQTVVDVRYSAANFKGSVYPIELLILQGELMRRTHLALEEDAEFAKQISDMAVKVRDYAKQNNLKLPYGLSDTDLAPFIHEAMTNPKFQKLLSDVEYDVTGESTWDSFLKYILNGLKRMFKIKPSDTVLNEALHIITKKIDIIPQDPTDTSSTTTDSSDQTDDLKPVSSTDLGNAIRKRLSDLGYTSKDIVAMGHEEAVRVANANETKEAREKRLSDIEALEEELFQKDREAILMEIAQLFQSATDLTELERIENEVIPELLSKPYGKSERIGWNVYGYGAEGLKRLSDLRKKDLEYSFEFEDIIVGSTIQLKNRAKALVTKKTAKTLYITQKSNNKKSTIKKDDVKDKIKLIWRPDMTADPTDSDVTDDDNAKTADGLAAAKNTKPINKWDDGDLTDDFDPNSC